MYCGRDYSPQERNESEVIGLDFVNDLQAGETLISSAWTIAGCIRGRHRSWRSPVGSSKGGHANLWNAEDGNHPAHWRDTSRRDLSREGYSHYHARQHADLVVAHQGHQR